MSFKINISPTGEENSKCITIDLHHEEQHVQIQFDLANPSPDSHVLYTQVREEALRSLQKLTSAVSSL